MSTPIHCYIYRSREKAELYLYMLEEDGFDQIPTAVRQPFGTPERVMELYLTPERTLARCNVNEVMINLQEHGFHIQLPPGNPALLLYR